MNAVQTRTTTALLDKLRDPDNDAVWWEFDARYRRILISFARRLGLQDEDADDAAQETLLQFVRAYRAGKYDRGRGRLSSWVFGIARHCILNLQRSRVVRREARGVSAITDLPDCSRWGELWEAEFTREILRRSIAALREDTRSDARTVRAFELLAFDQLRPSQVAAELDMSLNDVYLAKHRCLKRLRVIVAALQSAYGAEVRG